VLAQGPVNELSLRPELQASSGPDLVGAVLRRVVRRLDPTTASADLGRWQGTLQVSLRYGRGVGPRRGLQLLARDVESSRLSRCRV